MSQLRPIVFSISALRFLLVITLCITFNAPVAYTQNQSSVKISANAEVVSGIEIETLQNVTLGKVQPSQQSVVISPITDVSAGKMVASGIPNARIRVSFIRRWQLMGKKEGQYITYIYRVAGNDEEDQSSAELLETDNRDLQFNNEGKYYFWIGGNVDVSNAIPDNYEGEFTIKIEYI